MDRLGGGHLGVEPGKAAGLQPLAQTDDHLAFADRVQSWLLSGRLHHRRAQPGAQQAAPQAAPVGFAQILRIHRERAGFEGGVAEANLGSVHPKAPADERPGLA